MMLDREILEVFRKKLARLFQKTTVFTLHSETTLNIRNIIQRPFKQRTNF